MMSLAKIACAQEQLGTKQQADKFFDRYEYFKSLKLYLQIVNKKNNPDIQVIERVADCYRNINKYADAETWYAKAVINPKPRKADHYYYAETLLRNGKFDMAKEQYKVYFDNAPNELALKLSNCDSAKLWMGQKAGYKVENAKNMNTPSSDWGLSYDGKTGFIFTSDRIIDDGIDNRTGNDWFTLYRYDTKTNSVQPLALSSSVNDSFKGKYHIGPIALNKTADTAYITVTTEIPKKELNIDKKDYSTSQKLYSRRLQLIVAKKINDQWISIGSFPYNNIQKYSVSSAALSKNGRVLYFSSDMPGGEGKTDLWYCEKQANGTWGKPTNCGANINTKEEEDFPTLDANGNLYYASKGLNGMGGYDIYTAKGEKNNWSDPENLKYPVNTTSDDFYFTTRYGLTGYLSSNRDGGAGSDDIYSFNFNPADIITPKHIIPKQIAKNTPVLNRELPPDTSAGFVFEPIYYDLDRSNIRPDAAVELDKLVGFLRQYPTLVIEIDSYTDSRASGDYNVALSERRANAVVEYLASKGVAANRLVAKWYGKTNLVNDCGDDAKCTEAEHQLNRRTEFKVIAK